MSMINSRIEVRFDKFYNYLNYYLGQEHNKEYNIADKQQIIKEDYLKYYSTIVKVYNFIEEENNKRLF